jgi:hypothetical protein
VVRERDATYFSDANACDGLGGLLMRVGLIGLVGLLAGVGMLASPAMSEPALDCGSVVTGSVVLGHDVGPCVGDGIVVQGGAAAIDLNGHTISGVGGSGAGIRIEGSEEFPLGDVRVSNGVVTGFGGGVSIRAGSGECLTTPVIAVDTLRVVANASGINVLVFCGAAVNVKRNVVNGNAGDGIWAGIGNPNGPIHILENHVVENGGTGIKGIFDSVRRVESNFVARNGGDGIYLEDTVSTVRNNRILKNGGVGLIIRETIPSFIPRYQVDGNVADWNSAGGMKASSFPDPPGPPSGAGNSAKHNGNFQCLLIVCATNQGQARGLGTAPSGR